MILTNSSMQCHKTNRGYLDPMSSETRLHGIIGIFKVGRIGMIKFPSKPKVFYKFSIENDIFRTLLLSEHSKWFQIRSEWFIKIILYAGSQRVKFFHQSQRNKLYCSFWDYQLCVGADNNKIISNAIRILYEWQNKALR